MINNVRAGPDPGFPVGGRGPILGGFWPRTWALFSENVWKNERIGSCRGCVCWHAPLDPPMKSIVEDNEIHTSVSVPFCDVRNQILIHFN